VTRACGRSHCGKAWLRKKRNNKNKRKNKMPWQDEADDIQFSGPIKPKKGCKVRIDNVASSVWTVKEGVEGHEGDTTPAIKVMCTIIDDVEVEQEGTKPKMNVDFITNLARHPYLSKKTGEVEFMGRAGLYGIEEAFGFDPVFKNALGEVVEPFISSRTGRKSAPKGVEGVKRVLNPDFHAAYFNGDEPSAEWTGKEVYANIDIERSEQYGDKNVIRRFVVAPTPF